ncbi:MAG: hypothetical protein ACRD4O_08390, partial [Bryobacteraceae bacterium]
VLLSGTVLSFPLAKAQTEGQQTPSATQKKNDVPKQGPGERSPDLKQDKRQHPNRSRKDTKTQPTNPGDVPHRKPGKKSPDLRQPAPGTVPKAHTNHRGTRKSGTAEKGSTNSGGER